MGDGARDLCIDEAHMALDIFSFAVFFCLNDKACDQSPEYFEVIEFFISFPLK